MIRFIQVPARSCFSEEFHMWLRLPKPGVRLIRVCPTLHWQNQPASVETIGNCYRTYNVATPQVANMAV